MNTNHSSNDTKLKPIIVISVVASLLLSGTAFSFDGDFLTPWTESGDSVVPAMCPDDTVAGLMQCSGPYCETLRMKCFAISNEMWDYTWNSYFSEEQGTSYCPGGAYVTGLDCAGSHCDNKSLQCTDVVGAGNYNCEWVGPFSEESPNYKSCSGAHMISGLRCSGSYCDNLYIECCSIW